MAREEYLSRYLSSNVGRRAFLRGIAASGAALGVAAVAGRSAFAQDTGQAGSADGGNANGNGGNGGTVVGAGGDGGNNTSGDGGGRGMALR